MIFVDVGKELSFIVDLNKKWGRNVSNFLLAMNFNEILYKYLAILMIYKSILLWYNNTRRGTHGPIASPQIKKHNCHLFAAKYQAYGINHAQTISGYAFLFFLFKINEQIMNK